MKTLSKALIAIALMLSTCPSWAIDWDDAITNIVGKPYTGNKNFNAANGAIGTERGQTTRLRVAIAGLTKTQKFAGSWKGTISFVFADNNESGMFNCKYREKTNTHYVFTIVRNE